MPNLIKTTEMPPWMQLLQTAVDLSSKAAVGRKLDYSRTTISLVLDGKYNGSTVHIEKKVMDVFGKVTCPHLGYDITRADCISYCATQAPIQNPSRMRHWRACQSCEHKELTQ